MRPTAAQLAQFLSLKTTGDLAALLGAAPGHLAHVLFGRGPSYRRFSIRKKSGGTREIQAPRAPINVYQRQLLGYLSALYRPTRAVHGFCAGKTIVSNAKTHVRRRLVLNFDLVNFFPSIPFGRVRWALMKPPISLPKPVATAIAQLCCHQGRLPQGAATSPILSNLVCRRMDHQLKTLAAQAGCAYSRYADDITFSTREASFPTSIVANSGTTPPTLSNEIVEILRQSGFSANSTKTRLQGPDARKVVTGLVVNERPNLPRDYVRELRGALNNWRRHGEVAADLRFRTQYTAKSKRTSPAPLRDYLRGRLAFLNMVRGPEDRIVARYSVEFAELAQVAGPVLVGKHAAEEFLLKRCLWIVVAADEFGNERSATGFAVDGFGIVTCAHIFLPDADEGPISYSLVPAWDQGRRYPIRSARYHEHFDVALVPVPGPCPASLARGESQSLRTGTDLFVAGFPAWVLGDRPRIQLARCSQIRVRSMVRYALLSSAQLRDGDSGGPLVDHQGRAVGIVHKGMSAVDMPNSCVMIEHLDALATDPGTKALELVRRASTVEA